MKESIIKKGYMWNFVGAMVCAFTMGFIIAMGIWA